MPRRVVIKTLPGPTNGERASRPRKVIRRWSAPRATACIYRSEKPDIVVPGDHLDCGCKSVALYRCDLLDGLVQIRPLRNADRQRVLSAQYSGLVGACTNCEHRTAPERKT
jgi:hypothetical protein